MSNYPNLPGIEVTVNDGGLILPDVGTTESMLILAPCRKTTTVMDGTVSTVVLDAPQEPTLVRNSTDLKNNFGDFVIGGNVNEIAAAWKAAFDGGCRRIYLLAYVAPGATKSDGTTAEPDDTDDVKFNNLYNLFYGILQDFQVDHAVVVGATADVQVPLVVGDLGTAALDDLDGMPGVVTIAGSPNTYEGNFAKLVGAYAENQTVNNSPVIGYIGTSAPASTSLSDIGARVNALVTPTGNQSENFYSAHVSVVAGPELGYSVPGKSTTYYTNGVVTYAALVSSLLPESAPTNKAVTGVTGVQYNLSLKQLNDLSGARYVSFRLKRGQVFVTDGITTAPQLTIDGQQYDSDYTRLSTLRITLAAIDLIRQIADPFIGEPAGIPQKNAFTASVKTGLEAMRSKGAITDYKYSIVQNGSVIGQTDVTLQIVPAFETKKVTVAVSLKTLL